MLGIGYQSSSCSEGQTDFNPRSYRQLVNIHGVCDATWVAMEDHSSDTLTGL